MSQKATLRIRFNLNQRTSEVSNHRSWQRAGTEFASVIIREVGLRVAEDRFHQVSREIRKEIAGDVQREINNAATLYCRHVIGRSGQRNNALTLHAATTDTQGPAVFGRWKPLADSTVERKGHARFFLDRGRLKSEIGTADAWAKSFGAIRIEVSRIASNTGRIRTASLYKDQGAKGTHFGVARIKVFALGKINSSMLPELATGRPAYGNYTRDAGLADLIQGDAKFKIGGWNRSGAGAYRPSLEPFLAFALTRSIPAAVLRRVKMRNGDYSAARKSALR